MQRPPSHGYPIPSAATESPGAPLDNIPTLRKCSPINNDNSSRFKGPKIKQFQLASLTDFVLPGALKAFIFGLFLIQKGPVIQNRTTIFRYSESDKACFFALNFTWSALSFVSNGELCISSFAYFPKNLCKPSSHNHRESTKA